MVRIERFSRECGGRRDGVASPAGADFRGSGWRGQNPCTLINRRNPPMYYQSVLLVELCCCAKQRVHDDLLLSKSIENAPGRMLRRARKL
ncbi:hypothetical protein [Mesorhizobium sp. KR9-304]|uniref:hypothetical protein n=1 Tax=Mesorhizobium sp. KR9-304 TaxID=3156614 RepID=UPI0032B52C17